MHKTILKKAATVIAALSLFFSAEGQETGSITLFGHVSDEETAESLYYSSISLAGTRITNVSNADGMFSLKIPADTDPAAIVNISHLGHRTGSMTCADFKGSTLEHPLEIKLSPAPLQLDPATVKAIDAVTLFRSAFFKVKDNYPSSRVGMTAFYREMVRKGTAKYLVLNEAVIDIDKSAYAKVQTDRIGIFKGRGSTNYDTTDTLMIKLQGGINTTLQLDVVKDPFLTTTVHEADKTYSFSMGGTDSYDGHNFYIVEFNALPNIEDIVYRGKIYIDVESLAIGRIEFSMNVEGREEEASRALILKRPADTRFYINSADYMINYKCFDGLWYYDYCRVDVNLSTRKNRSLFKSNFTLTEEMAVTNHHEGTIAIEPAERVRFRDILSDKVADFTDDDFWEDYNIIEPDETIDVLIKKIVRQLSRRQK